VHAVSQFPISNFQLPIMRKIIEERSGMQAFVAHSMGLAVKSQEALLSVPSDSIARPPPLPG